MLRYRPEGGALGFCDPIGRRIVIDPELSPNAQVSTLVHELAHAHGLGYRQYGRAECEVIVESVTAIVLGSLGFDPSSFSVPYIAQWAQDDDGLKALEKFAATIARFRAPVDPRPHARMRASTSSVLSRSRWSVITRPLPP